MQTRELHFVLLLPTITNVLNIKEWLACYELTYFVLVNNLIGLQTNFVARLLIRDAQMSLKSHA